MIGSDRSSSSCDRNSLLWSDARPVNCSSGIFPYLHSNIGTGVKATVDTKESTGTEKLFDLVKLFEALSDRTRLRLLNLMDGREVCVCYFIEILGQSQPKISRHLAYLRRARIVVARREGKWVHYKIAAISDQRAAQIMTQTLEALKAEREMRLDRQTLERLSSGPGLCSIDGAPVPIKVPPSASRHQLSSRSSAHKK